MKTQIWRRLHWTTWCATAVVAAALVQCQLTAKNFSLPRSIFRTSKYSFGWPCGAVVRTHIKDIVGNGLTRERPGLRVWHCKPAVMVLNLIVCLAVLASVARVMELRRRKSCWWQFSLKSLFALVYASSAILASYQFTSRDVMNTPELGWALFADSDCWLRECLDPFWDFNLVFRSWDYDEPKWPWLPMFFAIACTHYATGLLILTVIERLAGRLSLTPSRSHPAGGD